MADQGSALNVEAIFKDCDPLIKGRIRNKLRVSLDESDGSKRNQDALLKVYGEITLKFIEKLTEAETGDEAIRNFRGYALALTDNAIATYLNDINPDRRILKDKLRYFLETRQGFAIWKKDERLICGLALWQLRTDRPERSAALIDLRNDPALIDRAAVPHKHLDRIKPDEWTRLLAAIFNYTGGPVALDDLVNLVAGLLGIKDEFQRASTRTDDDDDYTAYDPPEPGPPRPLTEAMIREYLRHLWQAICLLKPLMRAAYLLSLGTVGKKATSLSMIELELFPAYEVVSKIEIGRLLAITDEQFERLWDELDMDEASRRVARSLTGYDEKFAMLWNHLPLKDDEVIARLLGCKPPTVATSRFRAINDYLAPAMRALGY
ncbi:MAG TPA: hypothetical protein VNN73_23830 [Blastocatellia bacterium]|nr:hypothetical protein [Blastocatellia bacterium]